MRESDLVIDVSNGKKQGKAPLVWQTYGNLQAINDHDDDDGKRGAFANWTQARETGVSCTEGKPTQLHTEKGPLH